LQGIECGCISCKIIKENRNILFSTEEYEKEFQERKKIDRIRKSNIHLTP